MKNNENPNRIETAFDCDNLRLYLLSVQTGDYMILGFKNQADLQQALEELFAYKRWWFLFNWKKITNYQVILDKAQHFLGHIEIPDQSQCHTFNQWALTIMKSLDKFSS